MCGKAGTTRWMLERLTALRQSWLSSSGRGKTRAANCPGFLLRTNTEAAQAIGVFGVPAFEVDGRLFWGLDGLPMLRAYLDGDVWFEGPDWDAVSQLASGLTPKNAGTPRILKVPLRVSP